jgi:superfamily II DNA or RNA helicase
VKKYKKRFNMIATFILNYIYSMVYVYIANIYRVVDIGGTYHFVLKFGITNDYNTRLIAYNVGTFNHPYYIAIYDIHITDLYRSLSTYKAIDFIFSHTARNEKYITMLEYNAKYELPFLHTLNSHLVNRSGSIQIAEINEFSELIFPTGVDIIHQIIQHEFPKLGLIVNRQFNKVELKEINSRMSRIVHSHNTHNKHLIQSQYELSKERLLKLYKHMFILKANDFQRSIKEQTVRYYETHDVGTVIVPCGVGKTILSFLVAYWLNCYSICIGFPSTQNREDIKRDLVKTFGPNILSNVLCIDGTYDGTIQDIYNWLQSRKYTIKFVLTTYKSSHKLREMTMTHNYKFDLCIGDEAHHLVSHVKEDKTEKYQAFLDVKSRKRYYMTATKKISVDGKDNVYSMDDVKIFGHIICERSFLWAIENHKITDYRVLIVENSQSDIRSTEHMNMVSYTTFNVLHSPQFDIDHILLYANTIKKCEDMYEKLVYDLELYGMNREDVYMCVLTSKDNDVQHKLKLDKFIKSRIGIAITVYKMGEGFDCPKLDAVLPIEPMESLIRIVQSVLRPNRLNKNKPHKNAYYIFPFLTENDVGLNSSVRIINVLQQLDETVVDKIQLLRNKRSKRSSSTKSTLGGLIECKSFDLEMVKMKLIERKALMMKSENTEVMTQEEYFLECVRNENEKMELTNSKQYNESLNERDFRMDDDPISYCTKNGLIWKGWHWFLKLDTQYFIKDIEIWRTTLKELEIDTIEKYEQLCEEDARFVWDDLGVLYPEFTSLYSEFESKHIGFTRR